MEPVVHRQNSSTASTSRGPSPSIWAGFPAAQILVDPSIGYHFFDDFCNLPDHVSDQDTQQYASYIDTGVTIKQLAGVNFGQAEIAGNDADNDEGVLTFHGPAVAISDTAGSKSSVYFEARWKKANVADNALASFIGLAFDHGNGVPLSKTLCLTDDAGALGAFSFLGFHVDQANGDSLDFVYKADGQTAVVVIDGVQALAASTWYKLGFFYDPLADSAKRIRIFVDGVEQSTWVTATNIATATFPDDEMLSPCWCAKVGTGSQEVKSQLDWWRFGFLAPI